MEMVGKPKGTNQRKKRTTGCIWDMQVTIYLGGISVHWPMEAEIDGSTLFFDINHLAVMGSNCFIIINPVIRSEKNPISLLTKQSKVFILSSYYHE